MRRRVNGPVRDNGAVKVTIGDDGSLTLGPTRVISPSEIEWTVSSPGGPGGQHANRALTKVTAIFRVATSSLSQRDRDYLTERGVTVIRTSASRFRSQRQNRLAALEQLGRRLAIELERPVTRRATAPTRASRERRLSQKRVTGERKRERRTAEFD